MLKGAIRTGETSRKESAEELEQSQASLIETIIDHLDADLETAFAAPSGNRDEAFQIALCRGLEALFPERIHVCRGFFIDSEGGAAGDGILLLNTERFPSLRKLGRDPLKKVGAPADAAVAYIETRGSLDIRETSPSLLQALQGVAAVRRLPRASLLPTALFAETDPAPASPFYCAVWAREVAAEEGVLQARALEGRIDALRRGRIPRQELPDAIVAGSLLMMPALIESETGRRHRRPFYMPGTELTFASAPRALVAAMTHLAWALSVATRETSRSSHTASGIYSRSISEAGPSISALPNKTRIA